MNIELHVEELVLNGFKHSDRYDIGEVVEHELTKLFKEQGVPLSLTRGGDTARLDAGAFKITANSTAPVIASQVAHAVYKGLR